MLHPLLNNLLILAFQSNTTKDISITATCQI